ncbi:MAG TPA: tetratricopeptide repeat protein [Candidatus Acidoferrales bacterium]|nr:tetratricopeptide repeat protein [Candidatus Acidoferrales bacterium]
MRRSLKVGRIMALAVICAAPVGSRTIARAQGTDPNLVPELEKKQETNQQLEQRTLNQTPPKLDPQEEAAYKAFYDSNPKDADTRIKLGEAFLQKYPMSRYAESVYAGLTHAYYAKQDWKNFYVSGDKALALNPDDPSVLVIIGWVIPHSLNPNDPNAASELDKAEKYEKHAIEVVGAMVKPANMTDDQFSQTKALLLTQAHSGLGLVYFRRQQSEESIKELQQATQGSASPDPTDLFVLGLDLQSLNRYGEAAEAFNRCGQIPGALQDRCKQSADAAKKQAR